MNEDRTKKAILVVDDDPKHRKLMSIKLSAAGYRVINVQNGNEALETIEIEKPGLVLLDIMMPEMDGFETLKRIKARDPDIPVAMVTSVWDDDEAKKAMEKGENPMKFKKQMAYEVVKIIKGEKQAQEAGNYFEKTIQKQELPGDMRGIKVKGKKTNIIDVLIKTGFVCSRGEAKRLVEQGGVSIDGQTIKEWRKDESVEMFKSGSSLSQCAEFAGITVGEMIELLTKRGVRSDLTYEEFKESMLAADEIF